jgi:integrase
MSVDKRTYASGKTVWYYIFDAPGSTRLNRRQVKESGFTTKKAAQDAEAARRVEEQTRAQLNKSGKLDAPVPKTLAMLFEEYFADQEQRPEGSNRLALKTLERYREQAAYLSADLLAMALAEITPVHLNREWNRLIESGGHHRKTKSPRPLSSKTVRNIAGVVSTVFSRAIRWGIVTTNPVEQSEPPIPRKRKGAALTPAQQRLLIDAASGCWCLPVFLELSAATGARRGELLALRWADCVDGAVFISRSLSQTKKGLEFKATKTEEPRPVVLPDSAIVALAAHRKQQDVFRGQFGPDYRNDLDLIFSEPDGNPLKPDSISSSVSALFSRLKLTKPKGASLHMLRHSHGSHLLASGMELTAVSERLGHSSPYVTATVYSHAIKGRDKEAARKWDEFQRQGASPTAHDSAGTKPV